LIDHLERIEFAVTPRAGQQGLEVFNQRWHDHLVAMAAANIEQLTPQLLDLPRFGGQNVGNVIGK
jgi:hypothetical protein